MSAFESVSREVIDFVSIQMEKANCCAHDMSHVMRVANLATRIAKEEGTADVQVAYLGALLHDVLDPKLYPQGEIDNVEKSIVSLLRKQESLSDANIDTIILIVKSVGYKNLIKPEWDVMALPIEYRCVQDADLLDAIGAIGVSRCLAFSGKTNRKLFGVGQAAFSKDTIDHKVYLASQKAADATAVQHFFEKLLRLKDYVTTKLGKQVAIDRHQYMVTYLKQIVLECEECGGVDNEGMEEYIALFS